jgi:predicted dehydrogenase
MNSAQRIRWGVIGAGGIARRRTIPEGIIPADNASLAAVCSVECGAAVAREFDVRMCDTEQDLLAHSCDAVYIATPVHLHLDQVTRAAGAGKHVLCEKPLGRDMKEAEAIVTACDRAGVKLGTGLLMRFQSQHVAAKKLVTDGALGTPVFGRAQLSCWYPPSPGAWRQDASRSGGGSLIDMGGHTIDLLEMLFGRTTSVYCVTSRRVHDYPVEDTAVAMLTFAGGAIGTIEAMFNVPDTSSRNRLEIYGSGGSILAEGTIGQSDRGQMVMLGGKAGGYDAAQRRTAANEVIEITPEPVNMYRAQIEAFSQAILDDSTPPIDGYAGLWNQRVLAACYESAATGRKVDLLVGSA